MIKHTSAPTHTYIYIYIYTRVYRHFDCLDRRESTAATSPQSPPWKLDRCVRSFSVLCAPSLLFPRNVTRVSVVYTRAHTRMMIAFTHAFHAPRRDIWRICRFRGRRYVGGSGTKGKEGGERVREGIGNGAEVMSIIGFNIGALGKPVYKYPYGTVITT